MRPKCVLGGLSFGGRMCLGPKQGLKARFLSLTIGTVIFCRNGLISSIFGSLERLESNLLIF